MRILNFKEKKAEEITIEDLRLTVDERKSGGRPVNGVRHVELWDKIQERLTRNNINFHTGPIYATDGGPGALPGASYIQDLAPQYGNNDIRTFILRRVIGSFQLTDHSDEQSLGQIAISYHQQGIMIAYGQHVRVCSNLAIMGRDNVMSTYGEGFGKISNIEHMLEVIETWSNSHQEKRRQNLKTIEVMQGMEIGRKDAEEFIGYLNVLRVQKDVFHSVSNYALNQGQINAFIERYIKDLGSRQNPEDMMSLWDLYNIGTEFHKPNTTDLPLIIPNNIALFEAMNEKFNITALTT